jgi:hypothetical protein
MCVTGSLSAFEPWFDKLHKGGDALKDKIMNDWFVPRCQRYIDMYISDGILKRKQLIDRKPKGK